MCLRSPSTPPPPPPLPPPPPPLHVPLPPMPDPNAQRAEKPVLSTKRQSEAEVQRRRTQGTRSLRVDLNVPGSGGGLNIPR